MQHEYVFLDMDGVLCDFVTHSLRAHNSNLKHDDINHWNMNEHLGITDDAFWEGVHAVDGFWQTIPSYPWKDDLVDAARRLGRQVKVVTSPSKSPLCFSGKKQWHLENMPRDIELIICKSKHLLARPDRLLIDDADKNCEAFSSAGGQVCLFPQPWNENRGLVSRRLELVSK